MEQLHLKYKVIHRNVNPNNIYITRKGTLILDSNFFMKKLEKTKFYTLYEINDYVAPEMLNKEGYSFNADLYSLGIVLYECFFGKTPYKFK